MNELCELGVLDAATELRARRVSSVELVRALHAQIGRVNGGAPSAYGSKDAINAWARLYPEVAEEQARVADRRLAAEGEDAPLLCGVPVGLKDLYAAEGLPVTASSRVLEGNIAAADCTAWARMRAAGMVLVGHLHTHEFANGGTCDQVGNPWDTVMTASGSSGGSGAAVAARMVPVATGTDTAGSIRAPAAICGVSGVKPTTGRIPLDGVIPLGPTFDTLGPLARSVADCSAVLAVMAGGGAAGAGAATVA
ncbi:MAG: amidase, partial [Acidobacteriota bacterium]|nr:amidase [Acidobacteriota bacterium]